MRSKPRLFRLTATVALGALLLDVGTPRTGLTQPAPPPLPAPGQSRPDLNQGDPPERVGRIAGMTGAVSFHNLGDTQWEVASPNYPVSSGNAFWTEPSASAQLEVSDSRIAMAGGTEFDVASLDAGGLQGVAAQGEIYLHLRGLAPNEAWSVQTPRGLVQLRGEGRYGIVVGTTDQPTLVTVVDGAAQVDGPGVSLQIGGNQTATITGTDGFQGSVGPSLRDPFLNASLEAARPPPPPAVPGPPQVSAMAGGSDLIGTGSWSETPEYGQVWYPPVPATWVPYREGHWAYVAPWGWTWIDDAPWGFAPFHYGRWLQIGGRWAWTPGRPAVAERPVYAPALVTFIGIGAGVALGAATASGSVGWVPLGPREEFHPWYHASSTYVRQVNVAHVTNITNTVTINTYVNRGAATSIPIAAMAASRPVQGAARPLTAQEFATARPISGRQPIRPSAATAGVTPVVARQLNLAPGGTVRPAPGPAIRAQAPGAAGFGRPLLTPRAASAPPGISSGEPARPAQSAPGGPGTGPDHAGNGLPRAPHAGVPGATRPDAGRPTGGPGTEPDHARNGLPGAPHAGMPGATRPDAGRPTGGPGTEPGHAGNGLPGAPHPGMPDVTRPDTGRPTGGPGTEPGHAAGAAPGAPHAGMPGVTRPDTERPTGGPGQQPPGRAGVPAAEPSHPGGAPPNVAYPGSPRVPAPGGIPAAPHPGQPSPPLRPGAPQMTRPEANPSIQRPSPPAFAAPHPEPQHGAPPAPRPEPPHPTPPAPHAEARPEAPAHAAPREHQRGPNER